VIGKLRDSREEHDYERSFHGVRLNSTVNDTPSIQMRDCRIFMLIDLANQSAAASEWEIVA
jgi:hypothetical protein